MIVRDMESFIKWGTWCGFILQLSLMVLQENFEWDHRLFRTWYVRFPLMCVGLLPSKKPANRCLISKTPDFSKTPVYNHKVISRPRLRMG